jgi:TatD DNase family protein
VTPSCRWPGPLLVDSHCHLNYLEAPEQRLNEARDRGVGAFLCIGVDEAGIDQVLALAAAHSDVWASVGQHPEAAAADPGWIPSRLAHPRVVAAGEMGLDYAGDPPPDVRRRQLERFDYQLDLAAAHALPVVVHTRAAEADTLARLRAHGNVTGVLHCFTESWQMAAEALDMGYYVSISGIVTFRNAANVREVARQIPDDRLLIETDSPWLAPVPHRGKRNQPAFIADTAAYLASLRRQSLEALTDSTTRNFRTLFARTVGP